MSKFVYTGNETKMYFLKKIKHFSYISLCLVFFLLLLNSSLHAKALTLDEVLRAGIQANPEISSLEERIGAAMGAVVQAGTAPNPDASIKVEDYSPDNGTAKTTLGFIQRLEYPGKRSTRKKIASENVEILKFTLESTKLDIIYKLKMAFYDILLANENLSLLYNDYYDNKCPAKYRPTISRFIPRTMERSRGGIRR